MSITHSCKIRFIHVTQVIYMYNKLHLSIHENKTVLRSSLTLHSVKQRNQALNSTVS